MKNKDVLEIAVRQINASAIDIWECIDGPATCRIREIAALSLEAAA